MTTPQQELAADYSFARPSPAALKAAGYVAVMRYLSADPAKDISPAEARSLHAAGLNIGLIWETTADRALSGSRGGTLDGKLAASAARTVGLPPGCPLLVNIGDWDAAPAQLPVIEAYYHAWRLETDLWQTGGYGSAFVIAGIIARGAQGVWWQNAIASEGVSGGPGPHASLYQRVTPTRRVEGSKFGDWDESVIIPGAAALRWWAPGTPGPAPAPVPVSLAQAEQAVASLKAAADTLAAYLGHG